MYHPVFELDAERHLPAISNDFFFNFSKRILFDLSIPNLDDFLTEGYEQTQKKKKKNRQIINYFNEKKKLIHNFQYRCFKTCNDKNLKNPKEDFSLCLGKERFGKNII